MSCPFCGKDTDVCGLSFDGLNIPTWNCVEGLLSPEPYTDRMPFEHAITDLHGTALDLIKTEAERNHFKGHYEDVVAVLDRAAISDDSRPAYERINVLVGERDQLREQLKTVRRETLDEAAKIADKFAKTTFTGEKIARDIRVLAEGEK